MHSPKFPPYLALAIAVTAVSFSAIFIRLCSAPPLIMGFYRLFFASCLLIPFTIYQNKSNQLPMTVQEMKFCMLSGFFLAVHFAFWITSVTMTSISSATILTATQPLFVSLLGWLILKESLNRKDIFALLISFAGVIIICNGDFRLSTKELKGDLFALLAGALAGAYFLVGRKVRKSVNVTNYITMVYSTACGILAILAIFPQYSFISYTKSTFFWMLMLALVPTLIGHSLYNWCLGYLSAHKVGMTIFAEPLGATILAYFIFKEIPLWTTYFGGALILIGIYLSLSSPKIEPESTEILA